MYNFQNPYQYYNPYQAYTPTQATVPQRSEVVRVNGKAGAEAYQLGPNSQILLLDESAPVVWLKVTDGAGYPTVTGYNITPAKTEAEIEQSKYDALEKRITDLEVAISESNHRSSESNTSKRAAGKSNTGAADV